MVFVILICCQLQSHGTSCVSKKFKSFLCLLLPISQYYFIKNLLFVPCFISYVYLKCGFFCTYFFLCQKLYSYMLHTQFFIIDVFTIFLISMVYVLVKSFVFDEVIGTMLTLGNRNHCFQIYHLSPNHD